MGIIQTLTEWAANLYLDRPARNKSYQELGDQLEVAGSKIMARLHQKKRTDFNHRVLTHIVGIERWGQSRLQVFLGQPLHMDEYNGYRPTRDVPWDQLVEQFGETRAQTVALAKEIAQKAVAPDQTVQHNQLGPMSARAWLRYLLTHASREIYQVR